MTRKALGAERKPLLLQRAEKHSDFYISPAK
nr:MAG TPA: hypothetical protein [Caudoviricetes sp.]